MPWDVEQNTSHVFMDLENAYVANKTKHRFNALKYSMFDGTPFPKLKGRAIEIAYIGKHKMGIETGDFTPSQSIKWAEAVESAVRGWVYNNEA